MTLASRSAVLLLLAACAACGTSQPPLTDATSLSCPKPGDLPFRLQSHGFAMSSNATLVKTDTRIQDEASDTLGNPGGAQANVYLDDGATPSAMPIAYQGNKARAKPTQGSFSEPLPGENVSLWTYDMAGSAWKMLARDKTDSDGAYDFTGTGFVAANATPVYSMLEADGTCATHYDYLWPSGEKIIVVDIDGTLTLSDDELLHAVADESYVPKMMTAANTMAQEWAKKGYPIVYLTARTHVYDAETRAWLDMFDFPKGPIITSNATTPAADAYKTIWLDRMITNFGWTVFAAYGNAATDITAYANVSIPLDHTFIIGPQGGMGGTVAIPNMDYTQHITDFIDQQPDQM